MSTVCLVTDFAGWWQTGARGRTGRLGKEGEEAGSCSARRRRPRPVVLAGTWEVEEELVGDEQRERELKGEG